MLHELDGYNWAAWFEPLIGLWSPRRTVWVLSGRLSQDLILLAGVDYGDALAASDIDDAFALEDADGAADGSD